MTMENLVETSVVAQIILLLQSKQICRTAASALPLAGSAASRFQDLKDFYSGVELATSHYII